VLQRWARCRGARSTAQTERSPAPRRGRRRSSSSLGRVQARRHRSTGRNSRSNSRSRRRRATSATASPERRFLRLLDSWWEPQGSLLHTALQTLLAKRPEVACQLDADNLRMLSELRCKELSLLTILQLMQTERLFESGSALATSTQVNISRSFVVDPQHSLASNPGLWERIAAGDLGSPVPHCLTCWDGPESAKAWLQVGGAAGRLAACSLPLVPGSTLLCATLDWRRPTSGVDQCYSIPVQPASGFQMLVSCRLLPERCLYIDVPPAGQLGSRHAWATD
jgi:hypothetical protein